MAYSQPMERNVSPNKKKAVLESWSFRCAISGIPDSESVKLHVDHIIPLAVGGDNEFTNLVPVTATINLGKGADRYPEPLEHWLKFRAAAKVPECIRNYAKLSHRTNPLPADPSKIDLNILPQYLSPSKDWTVRKMLALVRSWIRYGTRRLQSLANRIGKSLASCRMKLVWLGIYKKDYVGLPA